MADRVYIHIGAPKSGTTFLQTLLWANQKNLAASGVLLPGEKKFDHNLAATFARSDRPSAPVRQKWQRLESEIRGWSGTVVLTNEWFSLATADQIRRFVDSLRPADVHIVFTARNLVNTVPAAWQETLKLGFATSLDNFVKSLDEPGTTPRWWWGTLDPAAALPRWEESVPAHCIHVVTVPHRSAGPNALWERFAEACGIAPEVCNIKGVTANESVGVESARLLQLIGPELRDAIDADKGEWLVPYRWIRNALAHSILAPIGGHKIGLQESDISDLHHRADSSVAALESAGYNVHGRLDELRQGKISNSVHPDDVSEAEVLQVALLVIPLLLRRAKQEGVKLQKSRERIARLEDELNRLGKPSNIGKAGNRNSRLARLVSRVRKLRRSAARRRHSSRRIR